MVQNDIPIEKRIKKEKNRLNKLFKDIDVDKKKIAKGLIENAAFMGVQMEEMMQRINSEGVTIKYQNGENQWGYKKSPDVDTYNSFIKQYAQIIKQLTDILPKDAPLQTDPLVDFIKKYE